jgi:hypothetical protein
VRGRKNAPNWSAINEEVKQVMRQRIGPKLKGYHKRITDEWDGEKPNWEIREEDTADYFSVTAVAPPGEGANKWKWVTEGTGLYGPKKQKIHIEPKTPGGVLAFPSGYTRRTRPGAGGQYKGPGTYTGETVFAKSVDVKGTKPAKLPDAIIRWIKPYFYREIKNAMRRAARKAKNA